jgi:ubiquinone/menaquinone biosynthesis C-methylase UbiE
MSHDTDIERRAQVYFDARAQSGSWGALYEPAPDGLHYFNYNFFTRRHAVERLVGSEPVGRMLDLGCGTGDYATLGRLGRYHGVDFASQMVRQAGQRHGASRLPVSFAAAAGDHIPYRADTFDLVLAIGYIEYLDDPHASLAEIRRVLQPRGRLVLQSFKPELYGVVARALKAPLRAVYRRVVPRRSPASVVHRPYTPAQLDRLVAEFGFEKRDHVFNNFYVLPQFLRLRFPGAYIRLSEAITRANPRGWSWLAINYIGSYALIRK